MRRRDFVALVSGSVAAWPLRVRAQEAGRSYRLGVLNLKTAKAMGREVPVALLQRADQVIE